MTTLRTLFIILTLNIIVFSASGQVNDENIRQKVLKKGIVDSLFIFGKWTETGQTETHLKYLGQVTTKRGRTFKIVNSIWFWGLSHRATSRILVFNVRNQYVGNYYLTMTYDLPTKLKNGKLIFNNTDTNCDKKKSTIINLKNGIPKQFFRKCKDKYGDICTFNSD
ncbi:hypothetical protein GCM10011514_05560 [Emticicia aquatilis]|uniref:DUF4468 domain-containing protein n=1 Tax=Emticicia aquatilis TaxID=1537369 RepID=A0A917DKZ4_9BACT|nr:hypothetical protein GCM10011514_05560 [Emticicia aquatilis]